MADNAVGMNNIGLNELVFLDVPISEASAMGLAAYTLSAPATAVVQVFLGAGNIFSKSVSNKEKNNPEDSKAVKIAIIALLIFCWAIPGWARKSGWTGIIFKILVAVGSLGAIKFLGKKFNLKLLLINIIVLAYFFWKWVMTRNWLGLKWLWRAIGLVTLGASTFFTTIKVLKLPKKEVAAILGMIFVAWLLKTLF